MEENVKGSIDLGDSIKRMDVLEATYGSQHQRGEEQASSESSSDKLKKKFQKLQSEISETLKNPKMKSALKFGAILLLSSQLMHASDTISESDNRPTPDQLPSLIGDYNQYLSSDRANGQGATEGINTLVELAKEVSVDAFSPEIKSQLPPPQRTVEILGLPIEIPNAAAGSSEPGSFITDATNVDVHPVDPADPKAIFPGLKVPDQEKYYGRMALKVVDSYDAQEFFTGTLSEVFTQFQPIEFTRQNGTKVVIDGLEVRDLKAFGLDGSAERAIGFTIEFTSTQDKNSEGGPISYGGVTVMLGADRHIVHIRRQGYLLVPQTSDIEKESVQAAIAALGKLGFSDVTWVDYTPASDDGKTVLSTNYTVTDGIANVFNR